MRLLLRSLDYLHAAAWRRGYDVLPVAKESRALGGMAQQDVFRLQGVLQRALGQGRLSSGATTPEWARLVAEALLLADNGVIPRAQLLQDVWVLLSTDFQRGGYFIEVGAGDGLNLSNTQLLETEFGWTGILCEPNTRFADAIRERRRRGSTLFEHAVGPRSGQTLHLVDLGERSTLVQPPQRFRLPTVASAPLMTVTTITPSEVLEAAGAPRVIDYLSVDTEGSESDILRSFPWDRHHVRHITVEHNHVTGKLGELDSILTPRGYRRKMVTWSGVDAWYIHADDCGGDGAA